jgi:hypothetical protein
MTICRSLVGAALPFVIVSAAPALAQQGNAAGGYHDFVVNGVPYRVPHAYHPSAPASPEAAKRLSFSFWASDGAPVEFGSAKPGRPSESADDFAVVAVTSFGDQQTVDMLQASVRAAVRVRHDREYGLDCLRPEVAPIHCITAAGRDPAAYFMLVDTPLAPAAVRTIAFSSKDGVYTTITFPLIGMAIWPAVLCQTYILLRRWRVSGGPAPDDCSKLPAVPPK